MLCLCYEIPSGKLNGTRKRITASLSPGGGGGLGAGLTHVVIGNKAQPQPDVGEGDSPAAQWLTVHQHPRSDTGEPQSRKDGRSFRGLRSARPRRCEFKWCYTTCYLRWEIRNQPGMCSCQ